MEGQGPVVTPLALRRETEHPKHFGCAPRIAQRPYVAERAILGQALPQERPNPIRSACADGGARQTSQRRGYSSAFIAHPRQGERLLVPACGLLIRAALPGEHSLCVERRNEESALAEIARQGDRLGTERPGFIEESLLGCQVRSSDQRLDACRGTITGHVVRQRQRRLQPVAPLAEVAALRPETPERPGQT